jgi:glutamate/tyrosine decarboxylase-like PLP-dependent enzyme
MKHWKKLSTQEQDKRITAALAQNIDYKQKITLGIPASTLDPYVFPDHASFLKDAPLLRCYVQNPNHIGCHTLGESELFFKGTQEIESEVIETLATDILGSTEHSCDGYIAAGGTEANIQAVWIDRNYFIKEHNAKHHEIGILCSEDTHYSIAKASNLLNISLYQAKVDDSDRKLIPERLETTVLKAISIGIKYFIVVANMGTTMFGSVDDTELYIKLLTKYNKAFKLHIDGAFGGFIYPISCPDNTSNFTNPYVSSITLDAHKMLQAPYGTGVFIVRKEMMQYVYTEEAQYVNGMDITLSGSRSGTNAIAIWMILTTYGSYGWLEKINKLLYRTDWCCMELDRQGISYFRHPKMNIITIRAEFLNRDIVEEFGLVPDTHSGEPKWYKIVVMDHVELHHLKEFTRKLQECTQMT